MELLQLRKLMGQHRTQLPRPFSLPADASEKHQFLADLLPTLTKGAGLETALGRAARGLSGHIFKRHRLLGRLGTAVPDAGSCPCKGTAEPLEGMSGFHWQQETGESMLGRLAAQHPRLAWGKSHPVCGPGWAMSCFPLQELKGPDSCLGF